MTPRGLGHPGSSLCLRSKEKVLGTSEIIEGKRLLGPPVSLLFQSYLQLSIETREAEL